MSAKSSKAGVLSHQQGIALPVTLILLFVLTLIGIATLRTSTFEESMAANSRLRQVAFNAAETTLSVAQLKLINDLRGDSRRFRFFGTGNIVPVSTSPGHTCEEGYCTPAKFGPPTSSGKERWEDPDLNVWVDDTKHIKYENYIATDLDEEGVQEAPRYIVEFLGNYDLKEPNTALASNPSVRPEFEGAFRGNCRNAETQALDPPNDVWPYCASDPGAFRITVRATAGPPARQAVVLIQSTIRLPFNTGG